MITTSTRVEKPRSIRLAAVMEAATVTGPAKNLLEFCRLSRNVESGETPPSVDPLLVTYLRDGDPPNRFVEAARKAGLRVEVLRERSRFDRSVIPQLEALLESFDPHILQTHNPKSHFLVRATGWDRRWPWVAFHHGYTAPDLKMRLYNQLNRWSLRGPRMVITVCLPFVDLLARQGVPRERLRVLHNSVRPAATVAPDRIASLRAELGLRDGERVVLAVGRLSSEKGQADLLRAAAAMQQECRLVLVGDGPDRARLQGLADSLGVASRLVWAGQRNEVEPFYALATALVLPSLSEGSPNVLLEAMAAGLPIASTRAGGVPEIAVHQEHALLTAVGDSSALAAALDRLLADAEQAARLGAAARLRAAAYTPEAYSRALRSFYQEVRS